MSFHLSPLRELRWALHVLANPNHHGVFLRWALGVRKRLGSAFITKLERVSPFLLIGLDTPGEPLLGVGQNISFQQEWESYMALSGDHWQELFNHFKERWTGAFDRRMARHSEWEGWAEMVRPDWWSRWERSQDPWWRDIGMLMQEFWEREFSAVWTQIYSEMQQDVKMRLLSVKDAPATWWKSISPRIRYDCDDGIIRIMIPWNIEMTLSNSIQIEMFPSVFCWPHLWVEQLESRLSITYQSQSIINWASPIATSERLPQLLEIMSEPVRFLILRHLFGTMGTTSSIAHVLRLSPSTVSRHLNLLHANGLVNRIVMGHYVLYQTNRQFFISFVHEMEQFDRPPVPAFLGWDNY
ncbi:helix-turn-helix transcriptional regulator [Sulfobacillus sp. hq2]|uniref:ArsR/SmtB family transcription factor n=1 Tax=Sulfobacillus TaxID=28033 RepID=UPI002100C416|nr:DUF5937 family protein [Sulfobacillus sp. hq2]